MSHATPWRHAITSLLLATTSILAATTPTVANDYELRVIAMTGDDAPGSFNGVFTDFHDPYMNELGQVTFGGKTSSDLAATGFWTTEPDDPQTVRFLAGEGWPVPGYGPNIKFGEAVLLAFLPIPANNGHVGFVDRVTGIESNEFAKGLFVNRNGQTETLAIEGMPVPGMSPGVTFKYISNLGGFSNNGITTFGATLEGPGIDPTNDKAIFVDWFGGLTILAREGAPAPGFANTTWRPSTSIGPFIDETGRITFVASLQGSVNANWSIWSGYPGLIDLQLMEGDLAPNGEPYTSFAGFQEFFTSIENALSLPLYTDAGGGNERLTLSAQKNGARIMLAAVGQGGPLGTWTDLDPDSGHIAANGTIVFKGQGSGHPDTDSGLMIRRPNQTVTTLIREGDHAHGFALDIEHEHFGNGFAVTGIDDTGRVYHSGYVRRHDLPDFHYRALWVIDPDNTRRRVLYTGEVLYLRGEWKQVESFTHQTYNSPQSGRRAAVNERGDVALLVNFHDGDTAIIHAIQPQPCGSDRNNDGIVDVNDLLIVLADWNSTGPYGHGGDADFDGDTDIDDLLQVLADFNMICN